MAVRDLLVAGAATAAAVGTPAAIANLSATAHQTGISAVALTAYVRAASTSSCGVRWQDLAGIGAAETGHGTYGGARLDADGRLSRPIESWAGAEGPMQFMPDTWAALASDGDGDGQADVNDIDDAAVAAARHLCGSGYQPDDQTARINAIGEYNGGGTWAGKAESQAYVELVPAYADQLPDLTAPPSAPGAPTQLEAPPTLGSRAEAAWSALITRWDQIGGVVDQPDTPTLRALWAGADRGLTGRTNHESRYAIREPDAAPPPAELATTGRIVSVSGIEVDQAAADSFRQLLAAAADNGITLGGYGYRTPDDQWALRERNCPDAALSDPSDCSPPTALPGTSMHEQGLAIDFTDPNGSLTTNSPAYVWLIENGPRYGWHNLPSEPWHFSTTGS